MIAGTYICEHSDKAAYKYTSHVAYQNYKYLSTTLETGNQVDENLRYYVIWPNVCKYQIYSLIRTLLPYFRDQFEFASVTSPFLILQYRSRMKLYSFSVHLLIIKAWTHFSS